MKTRAICLMLFCMVLLSSNAFAAKSVEVPGMSGMVYVDADSAVKQGGMLSYWAQYVYHGEGTYQGVPVFNDLVKAEVDLRTPQRGRIIGWFHFDVNGRQIGPPSAGSGWESVSGSPMLNTVLPFAKEGQDTGTIPPLVSDRY